MTRHSRGTDEEEVTNLTPPEPGKSWAQTYAGTGSGRGAQLAGCDPSGMANAQPRYTPEQDRALSRVNRLRILNLLLFFPFLLSACLSVAQTADPYYRQRYDEILPGVIALLILALVIRNKVVKRRLKRKFDVS